MPQATDARDLRASAAEVKFLVSPDLGAVIRAWARERLGPDPYGGGPFGDQYRTSSVYFDTRDRDVFYRRGAFGRSKYRARRYDAADTVFLERKLTRPGRVTKRRTSIPADTLPHLLQAERDRRWPGDWFLRGVRVRHLRPVCQLSYLRTARVGLTDGGGAIRVTLDEDVQVRRAEGLVFAPGEGQPVVPGQLILELKYPVTMPGLFEDLVRTFSLVPQAASKYRMGLVALGDVAALPRSEPAST